MLKNKDRLIVICPTQEIFSKVASKANIKNFDKYFDVYKKNSVIFIDNKRYASKSFVVREGYNNMITHYEYLGEFPEKWVIRWDNKEVYKEVMKELGQDFVYEDDNMHQGAYSGKAEIGDIYFSKYEDFPNDVTLLTLEQFKNIIKSINGDMKTNKELIGYKLNGKATAKQVALLLECDTYISKDGLFFTKHNLGSTTIDTAKKLGVLDLWFEPVYEEKLKEANVTIGSNDVRVTIKSDGRIIVKDNYNNKLIDTHVEKLKIIVDYISNNTAIFGDIEGYTVYIPIEERNIRIGCGSENHMFSINELKLVIDTFKTLAG